MNRKTLETLRTWCASVQSALEWIENQYMIHPGVLKNTTRAFHELEVSFIEEQHQHETEARTAKHVQQEKELQGDK